MPLLFAAPAAIIDAIIMFDDATMPPLPSAVYDAPADADCRYATLSCRMSCCHSVAMAERHCY